MSTDLRLSISILAQDAASPVVGAVGNAFQRLVGSMPPGAQAITGGLLAIGGAAVGIGVTSVSMASQFQASMLKVQALAGLSKDQMNQMGQAILQMAPQLGQAPKDLAEGLYFVVSAGFKGADALNVLRYAGMAAATGNFSAKIAADALTSALNAFGLKGKDAGNEMDLLTATVTNGKMEWGSYAAVVGKLASTTAKTGQSFVQTNAALDTYTNSGTSARLASNYLNNTLILLEQKTDSIATHAAKMGLSFNETKFKSMDFAHQLQYLNQVTNGNSSSLLKLLGNNSVAAGSVQFLNQHYSAFTGTMKSLSSAMKNGQTTQTAFNITQQGFGFTMKQLGASVQVLLINLGNQLLPVLTELAKAAIPIVIAFANWVAKSGVLHTAVGGLIGIISSLVATGTAITGFFQHNEVAMDALKAVLIGIGAGILVFVATQIPALVVGFIAWATAAGAAAIATLAAAWPFIAIGAVIAAVVFGIILAVQHWGQITAWLGSVWGAFVGWLRNLWNGVVSFFIGVFNFLKPLFIAAGIAMAIAFAPLIIGIALIFAPIIGLILLITHFGQVAAWLQNIWHIAVNFVVGLFMWLFNHNYYFHNLVIIIQTVIGAVVGWLRSTWQNIVNFVVGLWDHIVAFARIYFAAMSLVISTVINDIKGFVTSIWNDIVSFVSGVWSHLVSLATTFWTNISSLFSGAYNTYIATPLGNIKNSITSFFSNLISMAVQWGSNLIGSFASGITGAIGKVTGAVQGIMGKVAGFLGFHSPAKEGPGTELMDWPINMVHSYADSLAAQTPYLQNKVSTLIAPLTMMSHAIPISKPSGALVPNSSSSANVITLTINAPNRSQDEAQEIAQEIAQKLSTMLQGQFTLSGGVH